MHLVPGDRVDRYVLVELLGEGGQGAVWKADDPLAPGTPRALKLVALAPSRPDDVERVRREARALARLEHPSIVASHALFEDLKRSLLGIAMDFVDGASLRSVENDPRLTLRHRSCALRSLARALAYVHRSGLVHRDLKLDNVLVTHGFWEHPEEPSHVKLVDFGIAKVPGSGEALTQLDTVIGTPSYLAPEQIEPSRFGTAHAPAADVFAFGIMAYRLLVGGHPTGLERGATLVDYATAYRKAEDSAEPWPPLPGEGGWGKLICECLALRVGARIKDGIELERRILPLEDVPALLEPVLGPARASSPTVVASPAAVLRDTVDMPALGGSLESLPSTKRVGGQPPTLGEAPTLQIPSLSPELSVPQLATSSAAPAPPTRQSKSASSATWILLVAGALLLLGLIGSAAYLSTRPRSTAEEPPPLPAPASARGETTPPLELLPEREPAASVCESRCASGHGCGDSCDGLLELGESFVLGPGAVWSAGEVLLRPGLELCMRRLPTDGDVCVPLAATADGGVPKTGLEVETFDLLQHGIALQIVDRTAAAPEPLARGVLRRKVRRQELCSGLEVELEERGDIERLVLFLDPVGPAPKARCPALFESRSQGAEADLDSAP